MKRRIFRELIDLLANKIMSAREGLTNEQLFDVDVTVLGEQADPCFGKSAKSRLLDLTAVVVKDAPPNSKLNAYTLSSIPSGLGFGPTYHSNYLVPVDGSEDIKLFARDCFKHFDPARGNMLFEIVGECQVSLF